VRNEHRSSRKGPGMLRAAIGGAAIAVLVVVGGASLASPTPGARTAAASAAVSEIAIQGFKFTPGTVTVPIGTTVTWVNHDDDAHTVTADDGRLASAGLDHGEQFSYRFTAPGTYAYHCALHPYMTARIIVK
jgi:plastocyanin